MDENNNQEMQETLRQLKEGFDSLTGTLGTVADTLKKSAEDTAKRQAKAEEERIGYTRTADGKISTITQERAKEELKLAKSYNGELLKQLAATKELGSSTLQTRIQVDLYTESLKKQISNQTERIKQDTISDNLKKKENQDLLKREADTKRLVDKQKKANDELIKILESPGSAFKELGDKNKSLSDITGNLKDSFLKTHEASIGLTVGVQLVTGVLTVGASAIKGLFEGFVTMNKAIYNGERGMSVSAKGVTAFTKELNKGAQSFGTLLVSVGSAAVALALLGGPIGWIGAALGVGAVALGTFTKVAGDAAETLAELNEVAAEQNDKLYEGFKKLGEASMSGAGGMTQLKDNLQAANMTVKKDMEKFTSIIVASGKEMKMFGVSAADGIKTFAETSGQLIRSGLGRTFELMGITQAEQAERTEQYMAQQAKFGMLQGKSVGDLVKGSGKYIEELDKLATLTGETRKEQEDSRKAVMANRQLNAAIIDAEAKRDAAKAAGNDREAQVQDARLKKYQETANVAATYQKTDPRLATGIIERIVSGTANTTEAAEAQNTLGKGIDMLEKGQGTLTDKLIVMEREGREASQRYASAGMIKGSTEGLYGGNFAADRNRTLSMRQMEDARDKAKAAAEKGGGTFDETAWFQKFTKSQDERTVAQVDLERKQQQDGLKQDRILFEYTDAAGLNKKAAELFSATVTRFEEILLGKNKKPVAAAQTTENGAIVGGAGGEGDAAAIMAAAAEGNTSSPAKSKQKPGLGSAPGRSAATSPTGTSSSPHPSRQSHLHCILDKV